MFYTRPLKFPPGTRLLVPWNTPVSFYALDFFRVLDGGGSFTATFDFALDSQTATNVTPTVTTTFDEVGVFTLRVLLQDGEATSIHYERFSWQIQVASNATDFAHGSAMAFEAAAHATFALPFGNRHVIVPLTGASNPFGTSYDPSGGGGLPVPSADAFAAAQLVLAHQFQQAFAYGFGRMPIPTATEERAVYVHMFLDSLVYGSSSALRADLAGIERWLGDAGADFSKVDALATAKGLMDALCDTHELSTLIPVNVVGGAVLVPGKRTVGFMDLEAWRLYATSAVNGTTPLGTVLVDDWRTFNGNFNRNLPVLDWPTAWRWEVTQTILQATNAMYDSLGSDFSADNARILYTCDPMTGACSIRIYDDVAGFWTQVTAAPGDESQHVELADMIADAAQQARGGRFVAVRAAGMASKVAGTGVPHVYEVHAVQGALDGTLFADVASIDRIPTEVVTYQENSGLLTQRSTAPDGTATVIASNDQMAVVTIGLPAIEMPDGKDVWASLRPHALYHVLKGAMTPVLRRG